MGVCFEAFLFLSFLFLGGFVFLNSFCFKLFVFEPFVLNSLFKGFVLNPFFELSFFKGISF
ncbi:hypothetical protein BGL70_07555 [Helicobacter pylori]|nr:hypothetical protein [Helicobacter pylori]OPG46843.1 hypothetical protein BGL70_07555 [Helicobacter pylori]